MLKRMEEENERLRAQIAALRQAQVASPCVPKSACDIQRHAIRRQDKTSDEPRKEAPLETIDTTSIDIDEVQKAAEREAQRAIAIHQHRLTTPRSNAEAEEVLHETRPSLASCSLTEPLVFCPRLKPCGGCRPLR